MPKQIDLIAKILVVVSVLAVYYWEFMYFTDSDSPLRHEYRIGELMMVYLTSPVWGGYILSGLYRYKKIGWRKVRLYFIPMILVVFPFCITEVIIAL